MYKYHNLNPISQVGLDEFTKDYAPVSTPETADAILVRSAAMHEMEFAPDLKAIARAGAGVNNIPLEKCAEQGIVVFNTPGANANGVKELVIAGMLLASRDIIGGINWVQENEEDGNIAKDAEKAKKAFAGQELEGKKLGVIGLGAIGVLVANAATHLGMDVYGYDPYISVSAAWNLSRSVKHISNVEDIYRECDYITIHVPLLDSTKKMVNAEAIAMMKPNAIVLNFARDLLVDEEAMVEALAAGKIKKYVSLFIFLLVLLIPIQVFAEYQQFVRRSDTFKVGQYGQFEQCVVINKDLSTKVISFNSWGNYAVKNNNGYSITMVSRKHEKKNNKLYIYLTVKGYDFNTKKYSSNYNFSFTISS